MTDATEQRPEPTSDVVLPCDVQVPPATTIRKGCKLSTLIHALELRGMQSATPSVSGAPTEAMIATEQVAKDRADWLLDAVAGATQDRRFLRGDPEYDAVAGEAILLNGEKAIRAAIAALPSNATTNASLVEALDDATGWQIERANAAVEANLNDDGSRKYDSAQGYACALTAIMAEDARAALTEAMLEQAIVDAKEAISNNGYVPAEILAVALATLRPSNPDEEQS